MLAQKIPRQPTELTRPPPSTGPRAMLRPSTEPQTPIARPRSARSVKVLVMMDMATGLSMDPPTPCSTRKATSQPRPGARLHSQEPRVKVASPAWKTVRRPMRSPSAPASSMRLASTIVYAAIVHCRPATEACSWRPIDGTATLTAVLSSPTMNTAEQQTASMPRRRRRLSSGRADHRGICTAMNSGSRTSSAGPEPTRFIWPPSIPAARPFHPRRTTVYLCAVVSG